MEDKISKIRVTMSDGVVTYVDLRRVVGVEEPKGGAEHFKIYFEGAVWRLSMSCYSEFVNEWLCL